MELKFSNSYIAGLVFCGVFPPYRSRASRPKPRLDYSGALELVIERIFVAPAEMLGCTATAFMTQRWQPLRRCMTVADDQTPASLHPRVIRPAPGPGEQIIDYWRYHPSEDIMQHDLGSSNISSPADNLASSPPVQAGRKRKAPSSTSRGVASLTPEQLAKKRANDREAQRAIRERTKQQIESLERRIQELTSQQPYQELQAVIRQKDAIQAENEEIRRRLASIMSIIQPIVGAQGLTGTPRV